jgi:hypothetical protein
MYRSKYYSAQYNCGHRIVFQAPYWSCDGAIEYVFNSLQTRLQMKINGVDSVFQLVNKINVIIRGMPSFKRYFLHVGFGVVTGISPPKATNMPTCCATCRHVGAVMSATSSLLGSSDTVSMSCRHDNYPTCLHTSAKKLLIVLQYYATIK